MPDISMCSGKNCPIALHCYRYTATPSKYGQSYADFVYNDGCKYYWDNAEDLPKKRDELTIFKERLAKIGIDIEFIGNYPWIYLDTINGKKVTERFMGEWGFTVAFLPVKIGKEIEFTDIKKIFQLIRKDLLK